MNIQEIRERKFILEINIAKLLSIEFDKFNSETGIYPSDITIHLADKTSLIGTKEKVVVGASVTVEL